MYKEISEEQRAHDLAVQATVLHYQKNNLPLTSESDYFEFGCVYRAALKSIRSSIEEGASDLA